MLPALQQSERELPARLAMVYRRLGRLEEALRASDRALARVQGARRLNVLSERAEIHLARGDKAAAVATLQEALAYARSLPKVQMSQRQVDSLEKKLAQFEGR